MVILFRGIQYTPKDPPKPFKSNKVNTAKFTLLKFLKGFSGVLSDVYNKCTLGSVFTWLTSHFRKPGDSVLRQIGICWPPSRAHCCGRMNPRLNLCKKINSTKFSPNFSQPGIISVQPCTMFKIPTQLLCTFDTPRTMIQWSWVVVVAVVVY